MVINIFNLNIERLTWKNKKDKTSKPEQHMLLKYRDAQIDMVNKLNKYHRKSQKKLKPLAKLE